MPMKRYAKDFYFTKEEEALIIRLVADNESVLCSSGSNCAPLADKRAIWQRIADEVNALNPNTTRSAREINQKWRNIKRSLLTPEVAEARKKRKFDDNSSDDGTGLFSDESEDEILEESEAKRPKMVVKASEPRFYRVRPEKPKPPPPRPKLVRLAAKSTEQLKREVLLEELEVLKAQKQVWSLANEVLKGVGDKIQLLINLQPVSIVTEEHPT